MTKKTKEEVDYSKGHKDSHCGKVFPDDKGYCRHYSDESHEVGSCELVRGIIVPVYWCKLWQKAK